MYSSPNNARVIKSRMILARHVELKRKKINACTDFVGNLKERDHLEDLGLDARILLKLILKIGWLTIGTGCVRLCRR
jgi:hypothetical protein